MPETELKRRRKALNDAHAAHYEAKQAFRSARTCGRGCKTASFAVRKTAGELEMARTRLNDMYAILRILRQMPSLLTDLIEAHGYNLKVRSARGNGVSVYYGGIGSPDGWRHGHRVFNQVGETVYCREPGAPRGIHNFR